MNRVRNALKSQSGYTLIELIVAMTIFALLSVVVFAALVAVSQSSTKTAAERKVQQDSRYTIEEVARQVRSSAIDYAFYRSAGVVGDPNCSLSTAENAPNESKALALLLTTTDTSGTETTKRVVYFSRDNVMYRYEGDASSTGMPSCAQVYDATVDAPSGPGRYRMNSDNVTVTTLLFYVSPNQDPYLQSVPCNPDCGLARNTHPRVTIVTRATTTASGLAASTQGRTGEVFLQTTVNSRAYPYDNVPGAGT